MIPEADLRDAEAAADGLEALIPEGSFSLIRSSEAVRWLRRLVAVLRTPEHRHPLTPRQRAVYDYIARTIHAHGYAPSFAEIAEHLGFASLATVHEHLASLERKGWITRRYNEARGITLTEPSDA